MIVLSVFDDASSEINAIDSIVLSFKVLELKGIQLSHKFFPEAKKLIKSIRFLIGKHTLGHPLAGAIIILLASTKLT